MSTLIPDVLALIISNVADVATLFSLLTVNKYVFQQACKTLYRDPVFSLRHTKYQSKERICIAFVKLILQLSPADDDDILLVRQIFKVKPTKHPPMLDYLSFVRVVRWEEVMDYCCRSNWYEFQKKKPWCRIPGVPNDCVVFITKTLTKAICHHQLHNIVEIEIAASAIEDYIEFSDKLSRVKRIFIAIDEESFVERVYSDTVRLVKAIQQHHGRELLQECHVSDMTLHPPTVLTLQRIELESLLPFPASLKGLHLEPLRLMDRYLSNLDTLDISAISYHEWRVISDHYHDVPLGRILQCCRKLIALSIEITEGLVEDAHVFAWAAQEVRDRAEGKLVVPAVPLKRLQLSVSSLDAGGILTVIKDALHGFARSLRTLEVDLDPLVGSCRDDIEDSSMTTYVASDDPLELPLLEKLIFNSTDPSLFDPNLLQTCPNLECLEVTLESANDASCQSWTWPLSVFPNLTSLVLDGVSANSFDPAALSSMPCLEYFSLEQHPEDPSPEVLSRMKRWTWDWHLPRLRTLSVHSAIEEWFSLKILRTCPALQRLSLASTRKFQLKVQCVLDDPQHDRFENVTELKIKNSWDIEPTDLTYFLQHVLPGVKRFYVDSFESCTGRQLLEATRNHPNLRQVYAPSNLVSTDEYENIGLKWVNSTKEYTTLFLGVTHLHLKK
ncbi:hypothetical protein BGW41_004288 [Actinomortierella wolfii]|nr:hypothetical protein BGW41_004288 [Actinomortierella wolfii]